MCIPFVLPRSRSCSCCYPLIAVGHSLGPPHLLLVLFLTFVVVVVVVVRSSYPIDMVHASKLLAASLGCAVPCMAPTIPTEPLQRSWVEEQHDDKPLQVQAHRGGAGMHAESEICLRNAICPSVNISAQARCTLSHMH